jgi:hypothetical protein
VTDAEARAQELLESQARLLALIANLRGAMVESAEGEVLLVNHHLPAEFESAATANEMVGRSAKLVLADLSRAAVAPDALLRTVDEPTYEKVDLAVELRSGRWLDTAVVPIQSDGTSFGRLWLFQDATARREAELHQQRLLTSNNTPAEHAELKPSACRPRPTAQRVRGRSPMSCGPRSHDRRVGLLLSDPSNSTPSPPTSRHQRNADRLRHGETLLVGRLDAGMLTLELQPVSLPDIVRRSSRQDVARPDTSRSSEPSRRDVIATPPAHQVIGACWATVKFTEPGTRS